MRARRHPEACACALGAAARADKGLGRRPHPSQPLTRLFSHSYPDASGTAEDAYGWVKSIGKFAATQRTEGISTSDLILRLIKDYNEYVLRNLSRGYTRQELGVSFVRVRFWAFRAGNQSAAGGYGAR